MEINIDAIQSHVSELKTQVDDLKKNQPDDKLVMVVLSGDLDKVIASFIIATGAAAMGTKVVMFFTFWGISALRDKKKRAKGKNIILKMFELMLPRGASKLNLSKMNFSGIGAKLIKYLMKKNNVPSLEEMIDMAGMMEVNILICEMSMQLMGFKRDEIMDYPNLSYAGVATFLEEARTGHTTLFI